jgi:cytochrome oxidase assembly protein ShyY1
MASMSKFGFLARPKWIGFHLLCAAAVVGMFAAGFWQLQRLDERKTNNAEFVVQIERPAVPLDDLRAAIDTEPDSVVNRRVIVSGTYSPNQVVLFNRSQGGSAVDNVLTPLLLTPASEGDQQGVLIVNRGAIGVEEPPPTPFPGEVVIEGRLRPSESRERGSLTDAEQEVVTQVRRVDLAQLNQLPDGGALLPMYVELLGSDPAAGPDDPNLLDLPELSEGNHLSYAVQWFIFAVAVAVGWVLAVRRSLTTRARSTQARSAATGSTG